MRRSAWALVSGALAAVASLSIAGGAMAAFPGTNGRIAFQRHVLGPWGWNTGWNIYSIDPASHAGAWLTTGPARDENPAYSADGERIAFARNIDDYSGIWVMNSDGSGQTQLSTGTSTIDDSDPAFSPDGTRIVFTRVLAGHGNQVWIMNADGSGQTQLTFEGLNGSASFSPDGERIVFTHFDQASPTLGAFDVSVMNADGSGQTPLTTPTDSSEDFSPDFSPDGRQIVFSHAEEDTSEIHTRVFRMNADGTGQTPVTSAGFPDEYDPAFSPDGLRVAFEYTDYGAPDVGLALVDATGVDRNFSRLTSYEGTDIQELFPAWQPLNPPSCELSSSGQSKSVKRIALTATCANENATLVAAGAGKAQRPPGQDRAGKARRFKLPGVTVAVPPGAPTPFRLEVSRNGRRALKKARHAGRKGKATIEATFTDDLGQATTDSLKVRFGPNR